MKYVTVILAVSVSCVHAMEVEKMGPEKEGDTELVATFHRVEKKEVPAVVDEQGNEIPSDTENKDATILPGQASSAADSAVHVSQGSIELHSKQPPVLATAGSDESVLLSSRLTRRHSPHAYDVSVDQIKVPESAPVQELSWYETIMSAICCKRRK